MGASVCSEDGRCWEWRVSQPEMQPKGTKQDRRDGREDLLGRSFPLGDWGEPAERLGELYQWAEQGALLVVGWYMADRTWKRRTAWALRAATAAGVAGGTALLVLELTRVLSGAGPWAFLLLLSAAICPACDRWFGLTSGWMRDVATAQAVQRRLEALQFDWAVESVREVLGPAEGTASEAAERCLGVLRRFEEDVTELVRAETTDWMVEFRSGPVPPLVRSRSTGAGAALRGAPNGSGPTRFQPPQSARPNMPRQRPPETPR
jgi:SMODS and SLOG-associating 2TM effector domain 2